MLNKKRACFLLVVLGIIYQCFYCTVTVEVVGKSFSFVDINIEAKNLQYWSISGG